METFEIGQVVVVKFPFSNLAAAKLRPALILAIGDYGNPILCQITSSVTGSLDWVVTIELSDILGGSLRIKSYARTDKIFTADPSIIVNTIGTLSIPMQLAVKQKLARIFSL